MKYDDASYHYGGDFPEDLPESAGGIHIGMFLAWAIHNDLAGDLHREESAEALEHVRAHTMTGCEFLVEHCDEKLTDEDLDEVGEAFATHYYDEHYLDDYAEVFMDDGESLYHVEDSWANYERIAPVITERFQTWRAAKT